MNDIIVCSHLHVGAVFRFLSGEMSTSFSLTGKWRQTHWCLSDMLHAQSHLNLTNLECNTSFSKRADGGDIGFENILICCIWFTLVRSTATTTGSAVSRHIVWHALYMAVHRRGIY